MSTIKVTCIDQTMALMSTPVITSGGVHENIVEFDFCPLWAGFTRTAVFWRTLDDPIFRVLNEEGTCEVPAEVLVAEGAFYFGVFGVNAEGTQRTTGVLRYSVAPGALRAGTQPLDPAPDIYVQLLAGYAKMETASRENAEITQSAAQQAAEAAAVAELAAQQAAKETTYPATVSTEWEADDEGFYYQDIEVDGITADDNPVPGVLYGSDNAANLRYNDCFDDVIHITTSAGSVRVWAKKNISEAFPIQLKVVR